MPYASNKELPESVTGAVASAAGQTLFRTVFNSQKKLGKSEEVSFASAWAALKRAGYEKDAKTGVWSHKKKNSAGISKDAAIQGLNNRYLAFNPDSTAAMPLPYNPNSLALIEEDQKPRFYAALTDSKNLPAMRFAIANLNAMQNRIDPIKVQAIIDSGAIGTEAVFPVIVRLRDGKMYIADGHHRVCAAWLSGLDEIDCYFKDLLPYSNALKSQNFSVQADIVKANNEQQIVYGWASIIEKDGTPVVDTEGDVIDIADLESAALEYVMKSRVASINHTGDQVGSLVESIIFSKEKQQSLGINLGKVGWWVGYKISDPAIWSRVKSGELTSFSIGGSAQRTEI